MKFGRSQQNILGEEYGFPLTVIGDAGIAMRGLVGGRMIPAVIVDTEGRPDVDEVIRVQQFVDKPGDVRIQWGRLETNQDLVLLCLVFTRPTEAKMVIQFDVVRQGILVEQALTAQSLYVQSGRIGDRVSANLSVPKVLVELPEVGFRPIWDNLLSERLFIHFSKNGLSRVQSRQAVTTAIEKLRTICAARLSESPQNK